MIKQVFQVGDTIRLDGAGWEHYCSTPLAGRSFRVSAVEDDGRAEFPAVSAGGGGWYSAWADPNEGDELFGLIVGHASDDSAPASADEGDDDEVL